MFGKLQNDDKKQFTLQVRKELSLSLFGGFRSSRTNQQEDQVPLIKSITNETSNKTETSDLEETQPRKSQKSMKSVISQSNISAHQPQVQIDTNNKYDGIIQFHDKYEITERVLGEGAHAIVKIGINLKTKEQVAIKICRSGDPEIICTFIDTYRNQRMLRHQTISNSYEMFVDENTETLHLVMEFFPHPSLEYYLKAYKNKGNIESIMKKIFAQLLEGVKHMHERGVSHRDLKPDNILVNINNQEIKIIDFGVSKTFKQSSISQNHEISTTQRDMWTRTGNYFYCAPEIFQGIKYNEKVDIWAIGVMLYQFLFGRLPFCQDTIIDTIDMITSEEIDFDELPNVSALAIDFLRRVLQKDPTRRLSAEDCLRHPWIYMEIQQPRRRNNIKQMTKNLGPTQFMGNQYKRSNSILISLDQTQIEELKQINCDENNKESQIINKFSKLQLIEDLSNFEDEDESKSPACRITKMKKRISSEIHIIKKEKQLLGKNFLKRNLIISMQKIQDSNEDGLQEKQYSVNSFTSITSEPMKQDSEEGDKSE